MNRRIAAGLAGFVLLLLGAVEACGGPGSGPGGGGGQASSPSPSSAAVPGGGVTGPRSGLHDATLDLSAGAVQLTVQSSSLGTTLYRVVADGGTPPQVSFSAPTLAVRTGDGPSRQNPKTLTVVLNQDVRWKMNLNGGATHEVVDFRSGRLQSLALSAGANQMDIDVGPPQGQVPVRVTGGANQIALRVPSGAAASLHVQGAANSVVINGQSKGRIAGGASFDVGSSAADRYQFDLVAGINTLSLDQG